MFRDGHHILHSKQEWRLRPEAKALREDPSLIIRLDREEHNEIHKNCPPVPLLGYYALVRTLRDYEPASTVLGSVENLIMAIEKSNHHPKSHAIERELGELTIWAIQLQTPWLGER